MALLIREIQIEMHLTKTQSGRGRILVHSKN